MARHSQAGTPRRRRRWIIAAWALGVTLILLPFTLMLATDRRPTLAPGFPGASSTDPVQRAEPEWEAAPR